MQQMKNCLRSEYCVAFQRKIKSKTVMLATKSLAALPGLLALRNTFSINRLTNFSSTVSKRLASYSIIVCSCDVLRLFLNIYCSELKRRLKAEQKLKEKAEKVAQQPIVNTDKKSTKISEEEISPNEYYKLRTAAVAALKEGPKDQHPYPHKFSVTISLEEFITKYNNLNSGEVHENETLSVAGRVHSIRESGAKLIFYDLRAEGVKIQVMLVQPLICES